MLETIPLVDATKYAFVILFILSMLVIKFLDGKKYNANQNVLLDCRIDASALDLPYDIYNPDTTVLIVDLGTHHIDSPSSTPDDIIIYFRSIIECELITTFIGSASAFNWL